MTRIKRMLPTLSFSTGSVVAIEIGEKTVRKVVVKKEGGRAVVSQVAFTERSAGDITEDMAGLLNGKGRFKRPGILVTDQVKFLASEINVEGAENLPGEKINAAAMWEIEPYLDFPPTDGLFFCRLQTYLKREDALPTLIFAMDKNVYGRFSALLKNPGVDLRRAYSPEGALAYASRRPAKGSHKIIIDYRHNALKGVLLSADGPSIFQDLPLAGGGGTDEASVRSLVYDLTALADGVEEIVIAGSAVSQALVNDLKTEFKNLRIWGSEDFGGLDAKVDAADFGPQYALAVGAALQELGLTGDDPLGVTDRVPMRAFLAQLFRENKRLAPALIAGLMLFFMVGHYVVTKASISRYTSKIQLLNTEKKKFLRPKQEKERLTRDLAEAKQKQKQKYIETVLAAGNNDLLNFLAAISEMLPRDVVLNRVYRKNDGSYCIEGNAFRGKSVSAFNQALSEIKACKSSNLKTIRRSEGASDTRKKLLPYDFVINVRF